MFMYTNVCRSCAGIEPSITSYNTLLLNQNDHIKSLYKLNSPIEINMTFAECKICKAIDLLLNQYNIVIHKIVCSYIVSVKNRYKCIQTDNQPSCGQYC